MDEDYADRAEELKDSHDPAGGYRGGKYSAYEYGTRVPMIVIYPNGLIAKGKVTTLLAILTFIER